MKANEFVKKVGWDKAKEVASFTSNVCEDPTHFDSDLDIYVHFDDFKGIMDESDICIGDLKRIVESWELVESYKGLHCAKNTLGLLQSSMEIGLYHGMDGVDAATEIPRLKQAIADVESCL